MSNLDFPHRLSLERRSTPLPITVNEQERREGCKAKLEDNGEKQSVPVCMGGIAIIGCNNYEDCHGLYGQRIQDPSRVHVLFRDDEDEGRVKGIVTVPRAPLVSPEDLNL
jgi:hypothetical protein